MNAPIVPPNTVARLHAFPGVGSNPATWMVSLACTTAQANAPDPLVRHGNVTVLCTAPPDTIWPDARAATVVQTTLAAGGSAGISFGDLGSALACARLVAAEASRVTATDMAFRTAVLGARDLLASFIRAAEPAGSGEVSDAAMRSAEYLIHHHLAAVMGNTGVIAMLAGGLVQVALLDAKALVAGEFGQ